MTIALAFIAFFATVTVFALAWYKVPEGRLTKLVLDLSSVLALSAGLLDYLAVFDWRLVAGAEYAPWLVLAFNVAARLARSRTA